MSVHRSATSPRRKSQSSKHGSHRRSRRWRRRRLDRLPSRAQGRPRRRSCRGRRIASGASGKALGGVRQQFSSAPEVRLARESVAFFRGLGAGAVRGGGISLPGHVRGRSGGARAAPLVQAGLGVPVVRSTPAFVDGLAVDDVLGAVFCAEDGIADPAGVTHELVRRAAALGVEVLERVDALTRKPTRSCSRPEPSSAAVGARARGRIARATARAAARRDGPVPGLTREPPADDRVRIGLSFPASRRCARARDARSRPRWGDDPAVDDALVRDWLERIAHRYPRAAGVPVARAWAGLV